MTWKTPIRFARTTGGTAKSVPVRLATCTLAMASFLFATYVILQGEPAIPRGRPAREKAPIAATNQSPIKAGGLPARFDLRSQVSLTPVKEQGDTGGCWAFASIATLETHLAFRKSRIVELSVNNLMTQLSRKYDESFDRDADSGGDDLMAVGYYAAWRGPDLARDDPFPESTMLKDMVVRPGIPPVFHVQEVLFLPERKNPLDNDRIKSAILQHGAVSAAMWKGSKETFGPYYNEETFAWYYDQAVANKEGNGHAVTIVGWDDTFPKENFVITPPGDGAFIVRNTKGPLWGQKLRKKNLGGYFYVSYYDRMFMTKLDSLVGNHVFSRVDEKSPYDRIYQYDLLGYNFPLAAGSGSSLNTASFANVFRAAGRYGELLKAVSFYALAEGAQYEVSVVTGFSGPESLSNGAPAAKGKLDLPGYYTIDLAQPIRLAPNAPFAVIVKEGAASTPVIATDSARGHQVKRSVSRPEESYVWNGKWTDLYAAEPNTNVCLKAFTTNLPAPPDKAFTAGDMKKDLEFALSRILSVHPVARESGLSRSQKAVIDSVRQMMESPRAREDFYLQMLRIFAMMGDGHTNLHGQVDEVRCLDLPVRWLMRDGIVVTANAGPLRKGDRVISIGGADEEKLLKLSGAIIPHENQYWVRANAPDMLRLESHLSFFGLVNSDATVDVEVVRNSETRIYRIPLTESLRDIPQPNVPMDWRIEKSNNLGYFRFDRFPSRDAKGPLAVEIGKFFEAVKKERVSNVVFDWRYNPGGNVPILGDILSYIKACAASVPGFGMITKKPKEQLFDGNLYVMTSHRTFSSAVVCTTVLSDNGLARILGEPTGENPDFNRHGEGGDGNLPVSGWHFMMVSAKSDRPRRNYSEEAVRLDIPVFTSRFDVIADRDIQLERLREIAAGRKDWRYAAAGVDIPKGTDSLAVERGAGYLFDSAKKTIVMDRDPASIRRAYFIDSSTNAETHEATLQNGTLKVPATLKPGTAYHLVFDFASSNIAFLSTVLAQSDEILDLLPLYVGDFSYVERFHYFIITFKERIKSLNPENITVMDQQGRSLERVSVSIGRTSPETLVIAPAERITTNNPCVIILPANAFVLESGATNPSALRLGNYRYSK